MTTGLLIYGEIFRISSYIMKPFLIYDFAPDPTLNFLLYEENFVFLFISVRVHTLEYIAEQNMPMLNWAQFLG